MDGTKKKRALVSPQVLPAGRGSGALLEFRWTPAEEGVLSGHRPGKRGRRGRRVQGRTGS